MAPPINANHQRTATEIKIVAINIRHCQDHHTRKACFHVGSTVANVTASGSAVGPGGSLVGPVALISTSERIEGCVQARKTIPPIRIDSGKFVAARICHSEHSEESAF